MGWIQLYAENCQEALDFVLLGYRLAETACLPVMLCIDGFYLSHNTEAVSVPDTEVVDTYLPAYEPGAVRLDPEWPITINQLTSSDVFTEIKHAHKRALDQSLNQLSRLGEEFGAHFGRVYSPVQAEGCTGADVVIVSMGSSAGTARQVAKELRRDGRRIGTLKVTSYRPFPREAVKEALKDAKRVAVVDRSWGLGSEGPLSLRIKAALYPLYRKPLVQAMWQGSADGSHRCHSTQNRRCNHGAGRGGTESCGPVWIDVKEGGELDGAVCDSGLPLVSHGLTV